VRWGVDNARALPSPRLLSFSYNQQNRLVQVANLNTALAAFQQNFLGERVAKSTSAGVFDFHYDEAEHLIAESDGTSGAVRNEYIWLDDMPVAMVSAGTLYFIHPDHLGTPQRITDGSQNIVWDAALRPFGEVEQMTQTVTLNLRFPDLRACERKRALDEQGASFDKLRTRNFSLCHQEFASS
jgi:uncharacterized protein RhaS with RHS repeats